MNDSVPTLDARQPHQLVRVEMSERVTYVKHYTYAELSDRLGIPIEQVPTLVATWIDHDAPVDPHDAAENSQAVLDDLDSDECWSGGEDRCWSIEATR